MEEPSPLLGAAFLVVCDCAILLYALIFLPSSDAFSVLPLHYLPNSCPIPLHFFSYYFPIQNRANSGHA